MQLDVRCLTCQRQERWTGTPDEVEVDVRLEGGGRRPVEHPQWARGKVALAALAGETGPVVGMCGACGQLLVAEEGSEGWPAMRVRIDTPSGPLEVHESITSPDGDSWSREQAERFLEKLYYVPITKGLAADVGKSAMALSLIVPFVVAWIFAGLFVISFVSSIWEGPAAAVRPPGFDLEEPASP